MDVSIIDIRMECLKLAVYSGVDDPAYCLAVSERYVDYVQNGMPKPPVPAEVVSITESPRNKTFNVTGGGWAPSPRSGGAA